MRKPDIHLPWLITGIPTFLILHLQYPSVDNTAREYRHELRRDFWQYYTREAMLPEIPTFDVSTQMTIQFDADYVETMRRFRQQPTKSVAESERIPVLIGEKV